MFDTHNGELTDDLLQGATLTLADGRKLKPARSREFSAGSPDREGTTMTNPGADAVAEPLSITSITDEATRRRSPRRTGAR